MTTYPVGVIKALYRYPVKSMAGESLDAVDIGWHGVEGDRRFAFVREGDLTGFPWLTAGKLQSLVLYRPSNENGETRVRTPEGEEFDLASDALRERLSQLHRTPVRLMKLNHGMFDDAPLSLIATGTIAALAEASGTEVDPRRFRPNILIEADAPFVEDAWVGKTVAFGDGNGVKVNVATRDVRCAMLNIDPDDGAISPEVLKAAVRSNSNCAGVYGAAIRTGTLRVGDRVFVED